MNPLEWDDRFFLLGKAIRLADRPEYETTVAGFNNDDKTVTLHHANNQPMDLLLKNYEVFVNNEWKKIGLFRFRIRFRHLMQEDYFRPIYDIPNQETIIHGLDEADASKRFFEYFDIKAGSLEINGVDFIES